MTYVKVVELTAAHYASPMGVVVCPSFSWKITSDWPDVRQTAFRLQLATDPNFAELAYDSGCVKSAQSVAWKPERWSFSSSRRYWWRVYVETNVGTGESDAASFVSGLVDGFVARWITAETDSDADADQGTILSTDLQVDGVLSEAYLHATALGVYQVYIDGQPVCDGTLNPGWSSYRKRQQYQTWDVKPLLSAGKHHIEAWLAPGWYKGEIGFTHCRLNYGGQTAFLGQLEGCYADGRSLRLCTDASWVGSDSPVRYADILHGEIYDGGLAARTPRSVTTFSADNRILEPLMGGYISFQEDIPAKRLWVAPNGETVIDFGQNIAGVVRFRVQGARGDEAVLQCVEALDAAGNPYADSLRTAKQTICYLLCGQGEETHEPMFTYQGFRYAVLKRWPGTPRAEDFTARVLHSRLEPTATFRCSEPLINRLWENIDWSLRDNSMSLPTDCPQRNERTGWTGDAEVFAPTACLLRDMYGFYSNWLKDLAADQLQDGSVPDIVPDILTDSPGTKNNWKHREGTHSAAGWADAAVIMPWETYIAYGDPEILARQYDSMKRWVECTLARSNDYTWSYPAQFGDWLALDAEEGSYHGATPNDFICRAYFARSAELLSRAASVLGRAEDEQRYSALAQRIKDAFTRFYMTAEGRLSVQTQTAHVLALCFRLLPDASRPQALADLKRLICERDGHLSTGFLGTPLINAALSDNGDVEGAYKLMLRRDFPSWLYQVERGATTVWEHWDGLKPDGSMWSPDMNSFNHYAYGSVGHWMFSTIGGLRPLAPSYRQARICPQPGGGLTHAEAALNTPYGLLRVAWRQTDADTLNIETTVPCNATAELVNPFNSADCLSLASGARRFIMDASGIHPLDD